MTGFSSNVFQIGDLVRRTRGRGGTENSKSVTWKIVDLYMCDIRKGGVAVCELVDGRINNGDKWHGAGEGFKKTYLLQYLTHVEE